METSKDSEQEHLEMQDKRLKEIGRSTKDMVPNTFVKDAKGHEVSLFKYKGRLFPPFGELAISAIESTEMRDDDVFISGYPKTGCHWTYEIMKMIYRRSSTPTTNGTAADPPNKGFSFLEMAHPDVVASLPSPRVLNSHVPFDQLPRQLFSKKNKIVLTVRNPKDTAVSFYNHLKKPVGALDEAGAFNYSGAFEDCLHLLSQEKLAYGCYFKYHKDWDRAIKENPDHPIIAMSYENMKEDLEREVRRLAKFLEVDLDDVTVKAIAEAGQFGNVVKAGRMPSFITRKGQVGDWKNWFTVAQNEAMDAMIAEKMPYLDFYTPRYTLD